MKYIYIIILMLFCSCGSSSALNERRYTSHPPVRRIVEFSYFDTFLYIETEGPDSHGWYYDISSTERVLQSRWQDLSALPATLDSVQVPLTSNDSTRVLLMTNIEVGDIHIDNQDFYRNLLSFVVETPRGASVPVSYLNAAALPRLRPGDSLRVVLTLDRERFVPRPTTNPVSSQWLRVTTDAPVLRVRLDMDMRAFNYRVVNDTLRATRRGWRWGPYEYTPDSQLESSRRGLDL